MIDTLQSKPGTQSFLAIKNTILELRENYKGLITIAVPTSTTSIFFRKQIEAELGHFYGIRFYSHADIVSLIQDLSNNEFSYKKTNHLNNIFDLKQIAESVFGDSSWMKISLVESTLKLLDGINLKQFKQLKEVNFEAFKIAQEFQKLKDYYISETVDISENLRTIFGKMILLYHKDIPGIQETIIQKCEKIITKSIELTFNSEYSISESSIFENAYDEANLVMDMALEASQQTSLSEMAIVVPNDATKRLYIAIAKSKKIPIAGSNVYDAYDDQVILAVRHLISGKNEFINEFYINDFYSRFAWLDPETKYRSQDLKAVVKKIHFAKTLREYFEPIYNFIEKGYVDLKATINDQELELIDSQYSIIKQLIDSDEIINVSEIEFLLKRLSSPLTSRIDTLGNGIYFCRPTEIIGTSFKMLFIVSLNVEYLKEETLSSSILSAFDIETLGLRSNVNLRTRETNDSIMNWLFNSAQETFVSTCKVDCKGKILLQSLEFEKILANAKVSKKILISETSLNTFGEFWDQSEYVQCIFSEEPNDKNVLIHPNRVTTFSASSFETLAKCPFRFFITKVLKTNEKKENSDIDLVSALERGSIIHKVLETEGLDKFDPDNLSILVSDKISELITTGALPSETSGELNKIEIMGLIETVLALHKQKIEAGFNVYSVEEKIEGTFETPDGPIFIKGKMDRVDVNGASQYSIVDYKTGEYSPKTDFFDFGKRLQLGLYAILLEDKMKVNSLEYWYLRKNPKDLIERIALSDEEMSNIKHSISDITSIMTSGIVAPRNYSFSQRRGEKVDGPVSEEDNCKNCEVSDICFSDHQEMWTSKNLQTKTLQYRMATHDLSEAELS